MTLYRAYLLYVHDEGLLRINIEAFDRFNVVLLSIALDSVAENQNQKLL